MLLNSTDSDDVGSQPRLFDKLVVDGQSTSASKTSDTQALINQTILQQLTAIGEWLNKTEQIQKQKCLV